MTKEYTKYFVELSPINKEPTVWHEHDKIGEDSLEDAREQLKWLKKSFGKNFTFRIVQRDYAYEETVIE
jgi:hypothetical protein